MQLVGDEVVADVDPQIEPAQQLRHAESLRITGLAARPDALPDEVRYLGARGVGHQRCGILDADVIDQIFQGRGFHALNQRGQGRGVGQRFKQSARGRRQFRSGHVRTSSNDGGATLRARGGTHNGFIPAGV